MNDIMSIALSGLNAASDRLSVHAQNIANQQSAGYQSVTPVQTAQQGGGVRVTRQPTGSIQQWVPGTNLVMPGTSLEGEMVGAMESETAYKASAKLMKTAQDLDKTLLDVLS